MTLSPISTPISMKMMMMSHQQRIRNTPQIILPRGGGTTIPHQIPFRMPLGKPSRRKRLLHTIVIAFVLQKWNGLHSALGAFVKFHDFRLVLVQHDGVPRQVVESTTTFRTRQEEGCYEEHDYAGCQQGSDQRGFPPFEFRIGMRLLLLLDSIRSLDGTAKLLRFLLQFSFSLLVVPPFLFSQIVVIPIVPRWRMTFFIGGISLALPSPVEHVFETIQQCSLLFFVIIIPPLFIISIVVPQQMKRLFHPGQRFQRC
mmetsp:Transcript_21609/g.45273  ORF Transcript_21609/g.45273 Transcript_21609/m.45273 type:complete len:256 (+) Transcript_21609:96-863(+)